MGTGGKRANGGSELRLEPACCVTLMVDLRHDQREKKGEDDTWVDGGKKKKKNTAHRALKMSGMISKQYLPHLPLRSTHIAEGIGQISATL